MKKSYMIAGAAILAVAVPAIAAHHEGEKGEHRGHMMKDMTRADLETKVKTKFAMFDADKDGSVTKDEMQAYRAAKRTKRMDMYFKSMDADDNGSISRAEFDAAHAKKHDKMAERGDKRGHHKMAHRGHRGGMMKGHMFKMADANGDGNVTLAEATTKALEHFDKVDADKNGTVTGAERMDYWKAKKAEWKAKKSAS